MTAHPPRVILLGPQRHHMSVGAVAAETGAGPVALISAGWQEWEGEDAHVLGALGPGAFNLRLYQRAEAVWQEDPELAQGHRKLQQDVRALRRAYNVRLARAMDAWIDLQSLSGDPSVLDPERADALEAVRTLDDHHAGRLRELRDAFYRRFDPLARASVGRQREQVRLALEGAGVVVVEGGHVPALLNRMRLFGLDQLLGGKVVLACSGGAMALAHRVVLFHDTPPWGPGHAELGEVGLGLYPGVVALPHGSARLRLDDPGRVGRLAARFAPDTLLVLDPGSRADWDGRWHPHGTLHLTATGYAEAWRGAA